MKKLILSILPVALLCLDGIAQSEPIGTPDNGIQIGATGAYMFGGTLRHYNGELDVDDGFSYGVTLSKLIKPGTTLELNWNGMSTTGESRYFGEIGTTVVDMNVNYILINALQSWRSGSDAIEPFGIVGLGVSIHSLQDTEFGDLNEVFFSAAFGIGSKFYLNDRIGIRIHGRLLMPMIFGGGSLWCGTGGCGVGVNSYATILQGDLGGGIFFRF